MPPADPPPGAEPELPPEGAPPESWAALELTRVEGAAAAAAHDRVAVEEPLEIRVGERSLLVTMRTPGHDLDLARGVLFTEGLVARPGDVVAVHHCRDVPPEARGNVVTVTLRAGAALDDLRAARSAVMHAGCGVCGKTTLEAVLVDAPPVGPGPRLTRALVSCLPGALAAGQSVFEATGGLHAAGLFAADGRRLALAEDIGRHNAVDKVLGAALLARQPVRGLGLLVTGRISAELAFKASRAGLAYVATPSVPSTLAVEIARRSGMVLVGRAVSGHPQHHGAAGPGAA
jgi:FdhD protein